MSKDNIGWIDTEQMKSSIAALRALRKQPKSNETPEAPDLSSVENLFFEDSPAADAAPELRPITDIEAPTPAQAAAEPIRTTLPSTTATPTLDLTQEAKDDPFDRIDSTPPDKYHVDRSLVEALQMIRSDADGSPSPPPREDDYVDASGVFTRPPEGFTPAAAPFNLGGVEVDEFGIPMEASQGEFSASAFEAVEPARPTPTPVTPRPRDDGFERVDMRKTAESATQNYLRSSLEAVTANNRTVDVHEDDYTRGTSIGQSLSPLHREAASYRNLQLTDEHPTLSAAVSPRDDFAAEARPRPQAPVFGANARATTEIEPTPIPLDTLTQSLSGPPTQQVPTLDRVAVESPAPPQAQTTPAAPEQHAWTAAPSTDDQPSLLQWLQRTGEWIQHNEASATFFIADSDGLPLYAHEIGEDEIALAIATRNAIIGARYSAEERRRGSLTYSLPDARFCHLVWHATAYGLITLGVINDRAIDPDLLQPAVDHFAIAVEQLPLG